jgi:hypothetical protein
MATGTMRLCACGHENAEHYTYGKLGEFECSVCPCTRFLDKPNKPTPEIVREAIALQQDTIELPRLRRGSLSFVVTADQFVDSDLDGLYERGISQYAVTGLPDDKLLICIDWPTEKPVQ